MLEQIATNDYGEEVEEHLLGIQTEMGESYTRGVPSWAPREVLELERWRQPDEPDSKRPWEGERGHLKRLLACNLLLRCAGYVDRQGDDGEGEFFLDTCVSTVIRLVESAICLGNESAALAGRFLTWLVQRQRCPTLSPFVAFGILLSQVHLQRNPSSADSLETCRWVEEEEASARAELGEMVDSKGWLFGLNNYTGAQGHYTGDPWVRLAEQICRTSKEYLPTDAHSLFASLVARLVEGDRSHGDET